MSHDWANQIKDNPDLLRTLLGHVATDPDMRLIMIDSMRNHPYMESSLKQHSGWMDSVHHPIVNSGSFDECGWCIKDQAPVRSASLITFSNPDRMMHMMHEMWIDSELSSNFYSMMIENPLYVGHMSEQMVESILDLIMDDENLRLQVIEMLLEHHDFMNAVRHDNPEKKP